MSSPLLARLKSKISTSIEVSSTFHQVMVEHFPIIKKDSRLHYFRSIDRLTGAIYIGDFYGVLNYLKVPYEYHQLQTEFNGFMKSSDYDGSPMEIMLIETIYIEKISNVFSTVAE